MATEIVRSGFARRDDNNDPVYCGDIYVYNKFGEESQAWIVRRLNGYLYAVGLSGPHVNQASPCLAARHAGASVRKLRECLGFCPYGNGKCLRKLREDETIRITRP